MENFDAGKKDLLTGDGLQIGNNSGTNWKIAGGWAKALGIVFIAVIGLVILSILLLLILDNKSSRSLYYSYGDYYMVLIIAVAVVLIVVGGMVAINLLRFGSNISTAVKTMDQSAFEKSLIALKNYFIISGIISIVGLLYTLLNLFKL